MSDNLRAALHPASIAVVGASDNPHKVGGRPILFLRNYGYRGKVFPVNPGRAEVQGYPAYADLASLPEAPEMAIVAPFDAQWRKLGQMKVARDGIIVAAMVEGRRELALGARSDACFGPVVMLGDGGKYVEALQDFILLVPPFDTDEVLEALDRLHIAPLLHGVRGESPLDLEAVAAIAMRLGEIMHTGRGRIASIDLNPVMVRARGEGAVVADALVELVQEATQRSGLREPMRLSWPV
jgi:acyl-CoA synthetase (NDP forming)